MDDEPNWAEKKLLRAAFPRWNGDTEELVAALRDHDIERGKVAATWLGYLGETRAIPGLLRMLNAADPHARCAAVRALGRLRAHEAADRVRSVLTSDPEPFVRRWAAEVAARLGDTEALPVFLEMAKSPSVLTRAAGIDALGILGDQSTIPFLRRRRRQDRLSWRYFLLRHAYRKAFRALRAAST